VPIVPGAIEAWRPDDLEGEAFLRRAREPLKDRFHVRAPEMYHNRPAKR
jgi:hypothetical protein